MNVALRRHRCECFCSVRDVSRPGPTSLLGAGLASPAKTFTSPNELQLDVPMSHHRQYDGGSWRIAIAALMSVESRPVLHACCPVGGRPRATVRKTPANLAPISSTAG
jgi:hypothetical protein